MATRKDSLGVPNTEPFDEASGYGDVITPGAQRHDIKTHLVNPSTKNTGSDAGGEGGTSGNYGGDATENQKALQQKNIP